MQPIPVMESNCFVSSFLLLPVLPCLNRLTAAPFRHKDTAFGLAINERTLVGIAIGRNIGTGTIGGPIFINAYHHAAISGFIISKPVGLAFHEFANIGVIIGMHQGT